MKPDRWTLKELAGIIIRRLMKKFNRKLSGIRERLGYWYCGHCGLYHSARVKKFDDSDGFCDPWCSLRRDDDWAD